MLAQFSKRQLQFWHLSLLFIVPILYTILKLNSEPHDYVPRLLGNALIVIGSAWSAYIFVMTVRHGNKENVLKNLLTEYRRQLDNGAFLLISDIVLLLAVAFLLHQLIFFRQIEFISTSDVSLVLSDIPGRPQPLGSVKGGQPTNFRVQIGQRHFACIHSDTERVFVLDPIQVSPWWSGNELPSVKINVEDKDYEQLEADEQNPEESN